MLPQMLSHLSYEHGVSSETVVEECMNVDHQDIVSPFDMNPLKNEQKKCLVLTELRKDKSENSKVTIV